MPNEAYYMVGAGGQYTVFITLRDLVVMRTGHSEGFDVRFAALCKSLLMQTIRPNTDGSRNRSNAIQLVIRK